MTRDEDIDFVSGDTYRILKKQYDELWELQHKTRDERKSYKVKLQDMKNERDKLKSKLDAILAALPAEPPCPCGRYCTCGYALVNGRMAYAEWTMAQRLREIINP